MFANKFTQDWVKRTAEEMHGQHCFRLFHGRDEVCSDCPAAITFQTGRTARATHTGLDKEGGITYAEVTTHPIKDDRGEVLFVFEYVRDISERVRFEQGNAALLQALRESEEKYRTIVENSNDLIWTLDREGNFIWFNQQAEQISGQKLDDWVGKSFVPLIVPEDLPRVYQIFVETMAGHPQNYEVGICREDGSVLTLSVNTNPLLADGEVVGTVSFGKDITERKQAEAERDRLMEQLRDVNQQLVLANIRAQEKAEQAEAALREAEAARHQITHLLDELELRVQERTTKLASANEELQAEISGRQSVEKALRKNEERFRNLVETTSDWVWEVDENAVYTYVSPRVRDLLGYEPEEVLGRTPFDLMPPDEAEQVASVFGPILAQRRPFSALENTNRHKDGHWVVLETSGVPFFDGEGKFLGYRGIDRDITSRKQTEEALRESEQRFRSAFESAAIGMTLVAPDGRFLRVNRSLCGILGYSERELLATTFQAITHPEDLETDLDHMRQMLAGEIRTYQMEKRYFHKLGQVVWALLSVSLVYDAEGKPLYFISQIQDITERKRVEQFREEYVSLISYDLRNPLSIIQGHAQVLKRTMEKVDLGDQERRSVEAIVVGTKRIGAMIQDLVDSAHMETGQLELNKEKTDLTDLVAKSTERNCSPGDQARLRIEPFEGLPTVAVDQDRIERAIMNLITNALKYSPADAPVIVRIGRKGNEAVVSVIDQGIGVSPEDLPFLFERFFRAKTDKKVQGLGLGLYITRQIVEAHGGRVSVESKIGQGSTFSLTLPLT